MDHINRTSESAKLHKSFPRGGNTTLENVQVLELHWRKKKADSRGSHDCGWPRQY